MSGSVYSVVELIGSSPVSWEEAAANAIDVATDSISDDVRIAEVIEQDVLIDGGRVLAYRSKIRLSYKRAADGA
jgi:dodecin